ncbi:MAG: penicillin-binding protein 1C [Fluviicola sp.]|nr:penicillin-binding protein 1C [Fluviicola sp.]
MKKIRAFLKKTRRFRREMSVFLLFGFFVWYIGCLPEQLFSESTSTVLLDRNGQLLGAHISEDEQWRFTECDSVPYKFRKCIVEFEDRRFYSHFGVSLKGIGRAIVQNLSAGKRVSGGSTITMQLIRLMRKNPARTYPEKLREMVLATRMEFRLSKDEILRLYSSYAPFGSNVVGLNAASWRFFGRPPHQLSWSESATLAVLPNAPGLIYPGRNHDKLKAKRNRLLVRLRDEKIIDSLAFEMALLEPLPNRPLKLPSLAPHLLDHFIKNGRKGQMIECTLDFEIQRRANSSLDNQLTMLNENKIYNGAILISSVESGEILAYVGNSINAGAEHSNQVDCIPAHRSSGSILKPILYAKALESGLITPKMLLLDLPSKFGGFAPKNFTGNFSGLIPADQALSRSLNIPMVHLLNNYGNGKFHSDLKDLGFSSINKPAGHYGLSLILGGAEVSLFDLANVYTRFAQVVESNTSKSIQFSSDEKKEYSQRIMIDKASLYTTFEAMLEVKRPSNDNNWKLFSSSRKIAWKTGTSFGFRDAWAVGITPDYVVSVWVGNADGEGRPGLIGVQAAAPIMFDIFSFLPEKKEWFDNFNSQKQVISICKKSGHRATKYCINTAQMEVPKSCLKAKACPYHSLVHLDLSERTRVDSDCESPSNMVHKSWFILPPSIEKFYKKWHPDYKPLPPYKSGCSTPNNHQSLSIIYPRDKQEIYLPIDLAEQRRSVIFEAAHSNNSSIVFWHLDDVFYGSTTEIHQLKFQPSQGKHKLTLIDENGNRETVFFELLGI